MAEVLSQKEINELLAAISSGNTDPKQDRDLLESNRKIKVYDFKRPDFLQMIHLRFLSIIYERAARKIQLDLRKFFETKNIGFNICSVDQISYSEFERSCPVPSPFWKLRTNGGDVVFMTDNNVAHSMIKKCFNIDEFEKDECTRQLTSFEGKLIYKLFEPILYRFDQEWDYSTKGRGLKFFYELSDDIFSSPDEFLMNNEMGVLLTFEFSFESQEGMSCLFMPESVMRHFLDKLTFMNFAYEWHGENKVQTKEIPVPVSIELGRVWKKVGQLRELKAGNVIEDFNFDLAYICSGDMKIYKGALKENKVIILSKAQNKEKVVEEVAKGSIDENIDEIKVKVSAVLGTAEFKLKDLENWNEGTIVELDSKAGEEVKIFANGTFLASGEVVVVDDKFAIRILSTKL